jgi:hypothetical protein
MALLRCAICAFISLIVGFWPASVYARTAIAYSAPVTSYANHSFWKKNGQFSDVDIGKFAITSVVNDITTRAATVEAGTALVAVAGNNINITAGQNTVMVDEAHEHKSKGFLL